MTETENAVVVSVGFLWVFVVAVNFFGGEGLMVNDLSCLGGGSLPAELVSFVGRRREVAEVRRLLGNSRLVTLTGFGGIGKSRLALRVAGQARRGFRDGVRCVDVAGLWDREWDQEFPGRETRDVEGLACLVGSELGLPEQPGRAWLSVLVECLASRSLLLVLDNCEQLIPVCGVLVEALLQACPGLWVLATSREPLRVSGERMVLVSPLAVPDVRRRPVLAELAVCESVALFADRAEAVAAGFRLGEDNCVVVAEICRRLEGVPLAIELVTSWVRLLDLREILDRLDDRFGLLVRGSRSAPERHQSMRGCVDWSWELCTKPERMLWRRLSVFADGFELDAVEAVCADDQLPVGEVLDAVVGLVDKSILVSDDEDGRVTRYRMTETVREHGRRRLWEVGEEELFHERHCDWYQGLVTRGGEGEVGEWLEGIRRARANLTAVLEYRLSGPGEAEAALRLAVGLPWLYWWGGCPLGEGRRWLDRLVARTREPTVARARALLLSAELAFGQGDVQAAVRLLYEGERLARRLEDPVALTAAAMARGWAALCAGDAAAAVEALGEGRAMLDRVPRSDLELRLLLMVMVAAAAVGDGEQVSACRQRIRVITGGGSGWQAVRWAFAVAAWELGNPVEAAESARDYLRSGEPWRCDEGLGTAIALEVLAWVASGRQRPRCAAVLLGAARARLIELGIATGSFAHLARHHEACEQRARRALGEAGFQECFSQGCTLSLQAAVGLVTEDKRPAPASAAVGPARLTRRERQVAELVADGRSNKDIAAALVISQRTAETHVENILTKLGFTSRSRIATWATTERATQIPRELPV